MRNGERTEIGDSRSLTTLPGVLALICWLLPCLLPAQEATVKEEKREILTYPYSDPGPVPVMAVSSMTSPFYPYFVFDGFSTVGVKKEWKVISLDNRFINVTVLPELGGKVWGAIEKSTGLEFVYQNHVMKFRAIGIRGPWTSGGIEHNFGLDLGHAPWTASPVDYLVSELPGGGVSCLVGGLDPASGTQWRVNIILPPDKAYFITKAMWYNPTLLHDAYLSWENGGFRASGDLQFFFPGYYYIGHDGAVNPWPADNEGRDLSWYKNNTFGTSKSYHVSGYNTGWFGGYWHDQDFGFGHYAPYSDAPGKKIWIWSLARDGAIWEDLLTDNDGQYIEAQSGVKFNQANRESGFHSPFNQLSIRPYYTETKTEYWFPVIGTKGMSDASEYGTINVLQPADSLEIRISPNVSIEDTLKVEAEDRILFRKVLSLRPASLTTVKIPIQASTVSNIRVRFGNDLLSWSTDKEPLKTDRPRLSSDTDFSSAEHLYRLADDMNAMREYKNAWTFYSKCLEKEPTHSRALYRMAELCYRKADYEAGRAFALKSLENDTYDGGANLVLGMINSKTGHPIQAVENFSVAARTMEYRSAAFTEIAVLRMGLNDFSNAAAYAGRALDYNQLNIKALEVSATACRKAGNSVEAGKALDRLLDIDPLCHYARFEKYLLDPSPANLDKFKALIRNELPHETYLEIAALYTAQGLTEEAVSVLEKSTPSPMADYWLAYLLRESSAEESRLHLEKAVSSSPFLVFPHGLETIPVLEWATGNDPSWKSKYYLALVYWHILRYDKAAELFELCGDQPDYAPFYIARGSFFRSFPSGYCHPCSDFSTAVKTDPGEWRTWHFYTGFLLGRGAYGEALRNAAAAFRKFPSNPVTGTDYAKALFSSGRFTECIAVLDKINILPQEGAHEGHDIYELANMSLALAAADNGKYREAVKYIEKSRNWPENLGAGKPYDPDNRFQDYLEAYCFSKLGKTSEAGICTGRIISFGTTASLREQEPLNLWLSILTMRNNGLKEEADRLARKWISVQDSVSNWNIGSGSSSTRARWMTASWSGNFGEASEAETELLSVPGDERFRLIKKTIDKTEK